MVKTIISDAQGIFTEAGTGLEIRSSQIQYTGPNGGVTYESSNSELLMDVSGSSYLAGMSVVQPANTVIIDAGFIAREALSSATATRYRGDVGLTNITSSGEGEIYTSTPVNKTSAQRTFVSQSSAVNAAGTMAGIFADWDEPTSATTGFSGSFLHLPKAPIGGGGPALFTAVERTLYFVFGRHNDLDTGVTGSVQAFAAFASIDR